jgi:hypothetical protein
VAPYENVIAFREHFGARTFYPISAGKSIFMRDAHGYIAEAEVAWPDSRAERLYNFVLADEGTHYKEVGGLMFAYPSLNVLLLLKLSHRYLKDSPHFLKTMRDVKFLKSRGAVIQHDHVEFLKQREKDTYTYNLPKLNVDKQTFFDAEATGVKYIWTHDDIHTAIRTLPVPAYTLFAEPGEEVKSSQKLFWEVGHDVRIRAVLEESMVLGIERSLEPFPGKKTPREAFEFALMKVCTSITSGFFREFAYNHYDEVLELFAQYEDYHDQFKKAVAKGEVRKYGED